MVPFLDLKTQYLGIRDEILRAVTGVLDSGQYILGDQVRLFEEEFAAYSGVRFGVGMNSGTSALHLALLAADIGPGDEVITPPHTFVATVAAICYTGATPVLVDIDLESYTMDPAAVEAAITPRTRAIMPVHLYGQPADMAALVEIADRRGLILIEDAAQAHGAEFRGRRCGSFGAMAGFSFYPGKNLGAYGEGGMTVSNREDLTETMRMLRDWGQKTKYHHVLRGFNARLEGIQGAVLRVKLKYLEQWTEARRERASRYLELLKDCASITLPATYPDRRHVYHVFAVRVADRDGFRQSLSERGVQTGIHYPFPVHTLPAYADLGYRAGQFPRAETAAAQVVSLPMYPELPLDAQDRVIEAVQQWAAGR